MGSAIYNEIEPFAAKWMRNLIAEGHIAPGVVDERSIADLKAADVAGPGQRHFFAGIGGWSYALNLAGVSDDADVWTGSCPCQPFSAAGKRSGTSDARHLWPTWFALIEQCRPAIVFGEQVASGDGLEWLDGVFADLERCGYAVGAADLCAAQLAPHGRSRLFFVAHTDDRGVGERIHVQPRQPRREVPDTDGRSTTHAVADTVRAGRPERRTGAGGRSSARRGRDLGGLGNSDRLASGRDTGAVPREEAQDAIVRSRIDGPGHAGSNVAPWSSGIWVDCLDGKRRLIPVEPALFPLAHGVPNRVGTLRGSGNAIVPQVAAAFITASLDAIGAQR